MTEREYSPRVPHVVLAGRGAGKTHDLVTWLCEGRALRGQPGWSRLLVVATPALADHVVSRHPDQRHELHTLGAPPMRQLVLPWRRYTDERATRGMSREVQVALDDVEMILAEALHGAPMPCLLSLSGIALPVRTLSDEHQPYERPYMVPDALLHHHEPGIMEAAQQAREDDAAIGTEKFNRQLFDLPPYVRRGFADGDD